MSVYLLDRYTNKYLVLPDAPADSSERKAGDKIVYQTQDKKRHLSMGIYLGHSTPTDKQGNFVRKLIGAEKEYFDEKQQDARGHFPHFKQSFKSSFAGSIPVTTRYQIFTNQLYCYFYSEQRYQFGNFVREFQASVGSSVFFYQIGARDMMRLSPGADNLVGCNGRHLCCKSTRPLPSIDIEAIIIQQLEGRDIERLKGRCGKLKCSIIYEIDTYIQESKNYPAKGQKVEVPTCDTCGICTSYNINTGDVVIKCDDGHRIRMPIQEIKRSLQEKKRAQNNRRTQRPPRRDNPSRPSKAKQTVDKKA